MKILRSISILVFILSGCTQDSQIFSISVTDLRDNPAVIAPPPENKFAVVLFFSPECPLCISYAPTIMRLKKDFSKCSIWTVVFPGEWVAIDSVKNFLSRYNVDMDQVLLDAKCKLVKSFDAKVTPSVFVLDRKGEVQYQGRIDNWMYETGRKRLAPDSLDLETALKALSEDRLPPVRNTKPVGCLIE